MKNLMVRSIGLLMPAVLCLAVSCLKNDGGKLSTIKFNPLPKQPAIHLEVATVEKFVDWVSTMPASQVAHVKEQIAIVRADAKVVDAVAGKLSFRNPGSYGRQLIYLSILGELKNEKALGPLQDYLGSRDCLVFEERVALSVDPAVTRTSHFDSCAGLKAAAVSMIAYLNTPAAKAVVLQSISDHASRTVRLSAMNALLYNSGDSAEAIQTVRQHARRNEAKFAGLPRLSPETEPKNFAERLARFYADYPEERPPRPTLLAKRTPARPPRGRPERQSVTPSAGATRGQSK